MRMGKRVMAGLVTTLLLHSLISVSLITAHASTVDDLRDSLGMTVEKEGNTAENKYEVIVEKKESNAENSESSNGASSLEQYIIGLERSENRLKQFITSNASANEIVTAVNSVIEYNQMLTSEKSNNASLSLNGSQEQTAPVEDESIYSDIDLSDTDAQITDDDFVIGAVGSNSISITGDYRILVKPWGYTVEDEGKVSEKLLGVEFGTRPGDSIKSQWNGIITDVSDDGSGGKFVTVFHGNDLYTKYSHVKPNENISSGTKVSQGENIGSAIDTTNTEVNSRSHILYQVILDKNYVNPLMVYGDSGKSLYESWYKTSSETNVIDENEEYFTPESNINTDNYKRGDTDDIIYSDFNITD